MNLPIVVPLLTPRAEKVPDYGFLHFGLKVPYFEGSELPQVAENSKVKLVGGSYTPPKPVFGVSRRGKKIRSMGDSISTKLLRMSFFFHYISSILLTFVISMK